jgi:hypothetical protein
VISTRDAAIASAAKKLNDLRENWLNPPEWTHKVSEVTPLGLDKSPYPERIEPKPGLSEQDLKALQKRTLTNLYNTRPAWLSMAHQQIDTAVAAAYGWSDYSPATSDEEILKRLLALNLARSASIQQEWTPASTLAQHERHAQPHRAWVFCGEKLGSESNSAIACHKMTAEPSQRCCFTLISPTSLYLAQIHPVDRSSETAMIRLLLIFLLLSPLARAQTPAATVFPAEAAPLNSEAMVKMFTGKVFTYKSASGVDVRLQYDSDNFAFVNIGEIRDSGKWRIENSTVCVEWQKSPPFCSEIRVAGDVIYAQRVGGKTVVVLHPK